MYSSMLRACVERNLTSCVNPVYELHVAALYLLADVHRQFSAVTIIETLGKSMDCARMRKCAPSTCACVTQTHAKYNNNYDTLMDCVAHCVCK